MKKIKLVSIALTAAMMMTLVACGGVSKNAIVAEPENYKAEAGKMSAAVTYGEFEKAYNAILNQYSIDPATLSDDALLNGVKNTAISTAIYNKILDLKIDEYGFNNLTKEQQDEVQKEIDETFANMKEYYKTQALQEDSTLIGTTLNEKVDKLFKDYLKSIDMTEEDAIKNITDNYKLSLLKAKISEDLTITLDDLVAEAKKAYEDNPSTFTDNDDYLALYLPENTKYVKHILIMFDDEVLEKINNYNTNGDKEGAQKYIDEQLLVIKEKSEEILKKAQAAKTDAEFDALIKEYGEDPGMETYKEGYLVVPKAGQYVENFEKATLELKNVGDISGLVSSNYGYHILRNIKNAEITKDDLAKIDIKTLSIYQSKINARFSEEYTKWSEASNYKINYKLLGLTDPNESKTSSTEVTSATTATISDTK